MTNCRPIPGVGTTCDHIDQIARSFNWSLLWLSLGERDSAQAARRFNWTFSVAYTGSHILLGAILDTLAETLRIYEEEQVGIGQLLDL